MSNIRYIYTKRKFEHRSFYDIIFEWEDELARSLSALLLEEYRDGLMYKNCRNKYLRKIPVLRYLLFPHQLGVRFDLSPVDQMRFNSNNFIPWIIDFCSPASHFKRINEAYKNHPLVLISCLDAYNAMISRRDLCPDLNLQHLALSLPDKYRIDPLTRYEKKYDVVLTGRRDEILWGFMERYAKEHPNVTYVQRMGEKENWQNYTNKGECLGAMDTRDKYIDLLRSSRVALYSTSMNFTGIQGDLVSYNQVTPRFLEMIAAGCHVILRYIPNADTNYYDLQNFSEPVETYEIFEQKMDYALSHNPDMEKYSRYLSKHYTSFRTKQLKQMVLKL